MAGPTVPPRSDAVQIAGLLDSPEVSQLVAELAATRWTGRPGYPIRAMVGMALTKSLYTLPTWTRTVDLVREHAALRVALGCTDLASVPSVHACYRFTAKLRTFKPLLDACLDRVTAALHEQMPELGATVAIDASDLPAYANGQRYLYKGGPERKTYSDPDASWGHRSAVSTRAAGSFYGFKWHGAVCVETGLPLAWEVATAKAAESTYAVPLLDAVRARGCRATPGMGTNGDMNLHMTGDWTAGQEWTSDQRTDRQHRVGGITVITPVTSGRYLEGRLTTTVGREPSRHPTTRPEARAR
jgi:hypothetical protein